MEDVLGSVFEYVKGMPYTEASGLVFGLLCVYFLIKGSVLNFVFGIIYVIISFFIFWEIQLYGDFILHVIFLILNIYGWYYWVNGRKKGSDDVPITHTNPQQSMFLLGITFLGVFLFGLFLEHITFFFKGITPSSLPYWDATTSVLSVTGMWLIAKKRIDNWYYWMVVDVLSTIIYAYKGIYFYSFLYLVYIGMAISGYLSWRRSIQMQQN